MVKRRFPQMELLLPSKRTNRIAEQSRRLRNEYHSEKNIVQKKDKTVHIVHLYPAQMNVYGDMGNVITLRYRLAQRGYDCHYTAVHSARELVSLSPDIIIGGGGQDSNQVKVHKDVLQHKKIMQHLHDSGTVGLMVCGMYQLLGNSLALVDAQRKDGAQVFNIETTAGEKRLIGNIVSKTNYGELVGFENHSGMTQLSANAVALGSVAEEMGNNGYDLTEGVESNNMFGTYIHGPVLAKSPKFADELLLRALHLRYGITELEPIDDFIELQAAKKAASRPR